MRSRCCLVVVLAWVVWGFFPCCEVHGAIAAPVRLGWNPAVDLAVRGYAIYYGPTNGSTLTRVDAGTSLNCTISDLTVGETYRIYAVSYDVLGFESIPSNQILFTAPVPAVPRLEIARLSNGSMRVSSTVTPGKLCTVQFTASLNPANWQTLTNVVATSSGSVVAVDATAKNAPRRFYRLFVP